MDDLKKYLQQHKDHLDIDEPSLKSWKPVNNQIKLRRIMWYAAAIILSASLLIAVTYMYQSQQKSLAGKIPHPAPSDHSASQNRQETIDSHSLPQQLPVDNASSSTKKLIAQKAEPTAIHSVPMSSELKSLISELEQQPIYMENTQFFISLIEIWKELKEDEKQIMQECMILGNEINSTDYLIQVYQKKIWLLHQLQHEITKVNKQAILNHQSDKLPVTYIKL